jgi:hypothetical protein
MGVAYLEKGLTQRAYKLEWLNSKGLTQRFATPLPVWSVTQIQHPTPLFSTDRVQLIPTTVITVVYIIYNILFIIDIHQ